MSWFHRCPIFFFFFKGAEKSFFAPWLIWLENLCPLLILVNASLHLKWATKTLPLVVPFSLVCVGGDGTFSELLNGLLDRTNSEANIEQTFRHKPISPSIRIGIIPAGKVLNSIVLKTLFRLHTMWINFSSFFNLA